MNIVGALLNRVSPTIQILMLQVGLDEGVHSTRITVLVVDF
jgi:hypothetical protein